MIPPKQPQRRERKVIYCPACKREFSAFRHFKTHLSATYSNEDKHLKLRGQYHYIKSITSDCPLYNLEDDYWINFF